MTRTRTYLEMAARPPLREGCPVGVSLQLRQISPAEAVLWRKVYTVVGKDHFWPPASDVMSELGTPSRRFYLYRILDHVVGVLKLIDQGDGTVEISDFGLIADVIGTGMGGMALGLAVDAAWELALSYRSTGRVWLHTSSRDHPNALPNYLARGFSVYLVEPVSE